MIFVFFFQTFGWRLYISLLSIFLKYASDLTNGEISLKEIPAVWYLERIPESSLITFPLSKQMENFM